MKEHTEAIVLQWVSQVIAHAPRGKWRGARRPRSACWLASMAGLSYCASLDIHYCQNTCHIWSFCSTGEPELCRGGGPRLLPSIGS